MASALMDDVLSVIPARYRKVALPWLAAAVTGALVFIGSYYAYDGYVSSRNEEVSTHYWQLTSAVGDDDLAAAEEAFAKVAHRATDEQYSLAATVLAAGAFAAGEHDRAEELYREVIERAGQRSLRDTARSRLAKVLLAKEQYADARQELLKVESSSSVFSVVVADLLGDISVAQGDLEEALSHYAEALDLLGEGDEQLTSLLRTKVAMVSSRILQGAGGAGQ